METIDNFLRILRESNKTIIVEGKKDKEALNKIGVKKVVTLSKKPVYKVVEDTAKNNKEVIILTDLDKEGKKLFGKLNSGLQSLGVRVDKRPREFLFKKTKLRQIEGITKHSEKVKHLQVFFL